MTKFERWFKTQFGALPNDRKLYAARTKVNRLSDELADAEIELKNQSWLQSSWTACQYTRTAAPMGFKT